MIYAALVLGVLLGFSLSYVLGRRLDSLEEAHGDVRCRVAKLELALVDQAVAGDIRPEDARHIEDGGRLTLHAADGASPIGEIGAFNGDGTCEVALYGQPLVPPVVREPVALDIAKRFWTKLSDFKPPESAPVKYEAPEPKPVPPAELSHVVDKTCSLCVGSGSYDGGHCHNCHGRGVIQ